MRINMIAKDRINDVARGNHGTTPVLICRTPQSEHELKAIRDYLHTLAEGDIFLSMYERAVDGVPNLFVALDD